MSLSISRYLSLLLLFIFIPTGIFFSYGQKKVSKKTLEKRKRIQLRKIKRAKAILSQTLKTKKTTLGQLTALNSLITARTQYLNTIEKEINALADSLSSLQSYRKSLQNDLNVLKEEYAETLYNHAKYKKESETINYYLSFSSFNELYNKIKILSYYRDARQIQMTEIIDVQRELDKKKEEILILQRQKNKLYVNALEEKNKLETLYKNQKKKHNQIIKNEVAIKKSLKKRKKEVERLNMLITKIVEDEINIQKRYTKEFKATLKRSSASFQSKKGKLAWPVAGFVVNAYGKHRHRTLRNVTVNNMGIGIQTELNESVVSVHKGIVVQIVDLPSLGLAIIIKHGDFYTVYSKVKSPLVIPGDKVKEGQKIAEVQENNNGNSELEFMVWNNMKKENPKEWLRR